MTHPKASSSLITGLYLALTLAGLGVARVAHADGPRGTLAGTVRVDRLPKTLNPLAIVKDGAACGKQVPDERLVIGADRALANVVVAVRGLLPKQAPPPKANATLDQVGCRYVPHVQAVTVGTRLALVNSDAVFHNVHANLLEGSKTVTVFNLAMPFKGQKLPTLLKRPGVMKVRCDAGHTWMSAYVVVFNHPYFAVTDGTGKFTIRDLPVGEHTVELWHEPIEDHGAPLVRTTTVKIEDGRETKIEAVFEL
jgi:plastocyanin